MMLLTQAVWWAALLHCSMKQLLRIGCRKDEDGGIKGDILGALSDTLLKVLKEKIWWDSRKERVSDVRNQ